jgi:hypothetical protein
VVARSALSQQTTDAMFALLASHFAGVERTTFERDLAEKNSVILIEDGEVLRGFSTLRVYPTTAPGFPVTIVYSGDTIVERGCWGSAALPRTWIQLVQQVAPVDRGDVYWLLLTSGYRTYRFLSVFFRTFYPRFDEPTPAPAQAMLDAIAAERFGSRYDAASGLVRFEHPHRLAGDLAGVPTGRAADAHVEFFLARNPGFAAGDELACLTRIHDTNLTPAGRRMARPAERGKTILPRGPASDRLDLRLPDRARRSEGGPR